jgi:hypothetical protein
VTQQIENYLAFQNPTNNVTFGYYSVKRHLDEINYLTRTQQNSWNAPGIKPDQLYTQLLAILDTTYDPANLLDSPLSQEVAARVSPGEQTQEFLRLLMGGIAKQQDSLKARVLVASAIGVLELQDPDLLSSLIDTMLAEPEVKLSPDLQDNMLEICQKFNCHEIKICRIITESNDTSRIQEANLTPEEEDTVRLFKNLLTIICDSLYAYHQQDFSSIFADLEQHKQFLEAHLPQQLGWLEHAKAAYEQKRSSTQNSV